MEKYILSVWRNHNDITKWQFDNCPLEQYLKNSFTYLKRYKKPYYYTPIYIGTHDQCSNLAEELKTYYCDTI